VHMQPLRIQFEPIDAPYTPLDRAIEWLLIGLLAFCVLAFGAVVAWSEAIFLTIGCAIAILFAVKLIARRDARFVWSWTYVPIALFVLLVIAQLIPLPNAAIKAISPNTLETKTRLLADLSDVTGATSITFYRESTLRQLRLVLAMAALFIVVINVFQRAQTIRRLLIAITLVGCAEAMLALAQDLTHSHSIYWTIRVYDGRALAGSFVNHSHFGQFMNLSIGAAIALLLFDWHNRRAHPEEHHAGSFRAATTGIAITTIIFCSIALLLSLTRGGMISMIVAGAFSLMLLQLKLRGRSQILKVVSLIAVVIALAVVWVGFDQVYPRYATLTDARAANWRGQMLTDLREAWKLYPIFGSGLGTHAVVFPMFDHSQTLAVATHAENEYAQMLTETGGLGLALLVTFIVVIWISFARAIRGGFSSATAIALGLAYGFLAILVHSVSDFGQHIPADAALTAVTCGLIVSAARLRSQRAGRAGPPQDYRAAIPPRIAAAGVVLAVSVAMLYQAQRAWAAESNWNTARNIEDSLRAQNWKGDDNTFARLLIFAKSAFDIRSGNVEYACWLNIYRWKTISRVRDGAGKIPPQQLPSARRIVDELNRVRRICPTYGLPACVAGQIQYFVLDDPRGADLIRLGARLAPNDPTACFVDGQLAAAQGDWSRSLERMKHYVELTSGAGEVVDLYVDEFDRADMALEVSRNDAPALEHLAELVRQKGGDAQFIKSVQRAAHDARSQSR